MSPICIDSWTLNIAIVLFVVIIIYTWMYSKFVQQMEKQKRVFKQEKIIIKNNPDPEQNIKTQFLNKIYDPVSGTSPMNPQGSFSNPRGYNAYNNFQMLGYITGPGGQFPVMGRNKYSGKSDKIEYYCINEGRNKIKIPFKTKNDNELYDGDLVNIEELGGGFTFKKYEDTDGNRYQPDIL